MSEREEGSRNVRRTGASREDKIIDHITEIEEDIRGLIKDHPEWEEPLMDNLETYKKLKSEHFKRLAKEGNKE